VITELAMKREPSLRPRSGLRNGLLGGNFKNYFGLGRNIFGG